jgi:uncharacterized membrane protein
MTANDAQTFGPFVAILAMGLATAVTRVAGYWLMAHVPMTIRVRRMLETLPGAIIVATIVPMIAKSGTAGIAGIAVTFAAMLWRRNEFLSVAVGFATIALLRAAGF